MITIRVLVSGFALAVFASTAMGQQAAAPYTHATRYNVSGQVTGTIAPDPDGAGLLAHKATRNTYGTTGATRGLLIKTESGELAAWADETVAPESWSSFAVYLARTFEYDTQGRKTAERVIGQDGVTIESLVQYSYDDWDRVSCKAVRMNPALFASPSTSVCMPGAAGVFGPDRITRYTYDNFGQVLTEERAVGTPLAQTYVTYTYYGRGVPQTLTDAKGNRTTLEYYDNWRLKKRFYPSPTSQGSHNPSDYNEYNYDANGNVVYERKRNNRTINNEFDNNNRLVFKNLSDNTYSGDIAYDYDLRGLALASCFGVDKFDDDCDTPADGEGETNVFDGFGNLESRISSQDGAQRMLSYQYDREGNRTRVTHPDGWFFGYGFDGLNRVNELRESVSATPSAGTSNLLTVNYRPSGGRREILRDGAATTTIEVDNALRLESFAQNFTGTTFDLVNGFVYNPASQVVSLNQSNTLYNYAEAKNRVGGYGVNGLNQYTAIDGQGMSYDAAGNLTNDGTGFTYTYDMENRLVATAGTRAATLAYDTLGRLKRTSIDGITTNFHYDGDALVGEYVSGALQRRYVHGDQVDEPLVQYNGTAVGSGYRRYLHADHQGSIIAHSENGGTTLSINKYDPYGIPASDNYGRFGYTGQTWLEDLGLNYYKARIYSPKIGRFLQTDPIGYEDDYNLYAYVGGDPFNRKDPSGLFGQGGGWSDAQWKKFDATQKAAAKRMDNKAEKLEAKAQKLDAKGKGGGDTLRAAAANLRSGAADLNGSTKKAHMVDGATMNQVNNGRCVGAAGCALIGGNAIWINKDSSTWKSGGGMLTWMVGHESLHSGARLNDRASTGEFSYKFGTSAQQQTFQRLQGTPEGSAKPDNLMDMVYPNYGEEN